MGTNSRNTHLQKGPYVRPGVQSERAPFAFVRRRKKFGIVVFPGSNCDHDCYYVIKRVLRTEAVFLWHRTQALEDCGCIVLPGGFSYGDYLRAGAISRFSPILTPIADHAKRGGIVLGICNGFQILTESGMLPGVLRRNRNLQFICQMVYLKVVNRSQTFAGNLKKGTVLRMPIAHGEGNYYAAAEEIRRLEETERVILKYSSPRGVVDDEWNPNGSTNNIAGIVNEEGNVFGMMPHPERCSESELGSADGLEIFQSIAATLG